MPQGMQDNDGGIIDNYLVMVGGFCHGNLLGFHARDGSGYGFLVEQVSALDPMNPQVTARLLGAFGRWRRFPEHNRELMRGALEEIAALPGLSRDSHEVVSKTLGA